MNNSTDNNNNNAKWDRKELGVLWKKTKRTDSEKYLSGVINLKHITGEDKDVPVIIFSNKGKKQESHPDYRIYLSEKPNQTPPAKPQTASSKPSQSTTKAPASTAASPVQVETNPDDFV